MNKQDIEENHYSSLLNMSLAEDIVESTKQHREATIKLKHVNSLLFVLLHHNLVKSSTTSMFIYRMGSKKFGMLALLPTIKMKLSFISGRNTAVASN